jgi:hypothetical protein
MNKLSILLITGILFGAVSGCTGKAQASAPITTASETETAPSATGSAAAKPTATSGPTSGAATDVAAPSITPTLVPDAWQSLPIVPIVDANTRRIYAIGQQLNNDPHAFSILGDCLSLPNSLFTDYGKSAGHYDLAEFGYLQPAIDWFHDSFNRQSVSLGNGFTSAAVLSPLMADPNQCQSDENPMECEYRIHHPSYALIALGTDDYLSTPDTYEARMRTIIEYTSSKGILPILRTKADNREGNYAFNQVLARLAYEYDIPLWNFWAAVQPLPSHGLLDDRGHLTWADPDDWNRSDYPNSMQVAVPVYNLTALQTLDAVWRGVTNQSS